MRLPALPKYAFLTLTIGLFCAVASFAAGELGVYCFARPFTYSGIADVPARDVAVVPGVGFSEPGRPPRNLLERLRVALALYRTHKVDAVLVSGVSDPSVRGQDEVVEMRRWLMARGVPGDAIVVDPAGYRTFDTMWRAANLLHVRGAIVCTQSPNMSRTVFLARTAGIDAVGLIAPSQSDYGAAVWRLDALKTLLAIADVFVLRRRPRVDDLRGTIDPRPIAAGTVVASAMTDLQ